MSATMGGLLILVSETMFLFSVLNFLLVTRIQYYNPSDSYYMRQLFPHYLAFLAALTCCAGDEGSSCTSSSCQARWCSPNSRLRDDRSPTYNLLREVHKELTELRGEVDEMRGPWDDEMVAYAVPYQAIR